MSVQKKKSASIGLSLKDIPDTGKRVRSFCNSNGLNASSPSEFNKLVGSKIGEGFLVVKNSRIPEEKWIQCMEDLLKTQPGSKSFGPRTLNRAQLVEYAEEHGYALAKVSIFCLWLVLK